MWLVCPATTAVPAPAPRQPARPRARRDPFAYPFSLIRQPAIGVLRGTTSGRLPIGLQIADRPFEDGRVLAAADAYEARFGVLRAPE